MSSEDSLRWTKEMSVPWPRYVRCGAFTGAVWPPFPQGCGEHVPRGWRWTLRDGQDQERGAGYLCSACTTRALRSHSSEG
jgi:hypothetical protein